MDKLRKYLSETPDSYIVLNEFLTSSEKECIKYDKKNEEIYSSLLNRAKRPKRLGKQHIVYQYWGPVAASPSNRDRFLIWKKRNTRKPVIQQSQAVLFLNSRNFVLDRDYEAYQAIDKRMKLKKMRIYLWTKTTLRSTLIIFIQRTIQIYSGNARWWTHTPMIKEIVWYQIVFLCAKAQSHHHHNQSGETAAPIHISPLKTNQNQIFPRRKRYRVKKNKWNPARHQFPESWFILN